MRKDTRKLKKKRHLHTSYDIQDKWQIDDINDVKRSRDMIEKLYYRLSHNEVTWDVDRDLIAISRD